MGKRAVLFVLVLLMFVPCGDAKEKRADLAGVWYTANPLALEAELRGYLDDAELPEIGGRIIGLIAPHAGFRYSGPIAAYTFKAAMRQNPNTVIIVGFSHRRYFPGISVLADEAFVTPLGRAVIDQDITNKLIASHEKIKSYLQIFDQENSIEMEIPFVQVALPDAKVVLAAIGEQSMENCNILADALYNVLRDRKNYVIVASTDMCHYLPYDQANAKDEKTIQVIKKFDPRALYQASLRGRHELMCGHGAVYATMAASKKLGADEVRILKYANSGDTSGMKDRVVGYLSAAFVRTEREQAVNIPEAIKEERGMFDQQQKETLLKLARDTIRHYLKTGERLDVQVDDDALKEEMGAFVTLHKGGQLRGCIGHMVGTQPFYLTVRDMAIASATEDPRFPPVTLDELDDIDIEVSALTPMRKIDDYNRIEIPRHGVMVRQGIRSGVYLPQVATETGWNREEFMNSLCAQKAGIPADAWKKGTCDIYVFTAEVFGEEK